MLFCTFSSENEHNVLFTLQLLKEAVHKHVTTDPQKYGLEPMTLAFAEHTLHVCSGHSQTWQAGKEITQVSVEGVGRIRLHQIR